MARETGFDAAYISRVERGLQRPSIDFLKAAASVLDLGEVSRTLAAVWP
jgi:transcriptional regulator with XRE-family HTH domain